MTIASRACLYGDGLFETMVVQSGQLRFWTYHWQRLSEGLLRLGYPDISEQVVLDRVLEVVASLSVDAVIRLTVTRTGPRGYRSTPDMIVDMDIQHFEMPNKRWHQQGLNVRWCEMRWARQPRLAGIKHLNRLEQVLARSEWNDPEVEEGIVLDTHDYVISGTMSAILLRTGSQVLAADVSQVGIDSVARRWAIGQLPKLGYQLQVANLKMDDVLCAEEIIFLNVVQGIGFVRHLANKDGYGSILCESLCQLWDNEINSKPAHEDVA